VIDVEGTRTLRATSELGMRQSAHCSSLGKAILAFSGQDAVDAFLKERKLESFTRNTITSPDLFMKELDSVRQKGFAVDDEEREDGLRCIGAPIWNSRRKVVAAVSIAGPAFRITGQRTNALAASVRNTAGRISAALDYYSMHLEIRELAR
jgi:DNA-binding IclR family transcriptional regulator